MSSDLDGRGNSIKFDVVFFCHRLFVVKRCLHFVLHELDFPQVFTTPRAILWSAAGDYGSVFVLPLGAGAQNLVLPMLFEGFR